MRRLSLIAFAVLLAASVVMAQRGGGRGGFGGGRGGGGRYAERSETPREWPQHSIAEDGTLNVTPNWTNAPGFEKDAFTFVRIKRSSGGIGGFGGGGRRGGGGSWDTDAPDSDLNISWRLMQMTSLKVNPDGRFLRLTDKELADYPFIYMVEPGSLSLDSDEVKALREYLLNGGFLWFDDFWGEAAWANVAQVMKEVFPARDFVEMSLDHPVYHGVFEIKEIGQIPGINVWRGRRVTWERPDATEVHHRAIYDDKGRLMVFATHNTDNGDGWEREGENHEYLEKFAEKIAYPLAVNVIYYTMTH